MKYLKSIPIILLIFTTMTNVLSAQDWAALGHFKAANDSLAAVAGDEDRVVFMGNSITIGWLNTQPEFFEGKPYVNRGISGQTTPQMLVRFRQDVIDLNPKVVIILAGTNDIAGNTGPMTLEQIIDNIKSMTEIARKNNIQVILCSVLPAEDYPWRPGLAPNEKIPALNKLIKAYCDTSDAFFLDYFTAMANEKNGLDKELAHDGVHPTKEGYKMMAPMAEAAIAQVLGKK
jgi:lysophospholipase L1-like esterase